MYNGVMRALQQLRLADVYGTTRGAALCPQCHLPADRRRGCRVLRRQTAVLVIEEGQPEYIEQSLNTILRRRDIRHARRSARACCRWPANIPRRSWRGHSPLSSTPRPRRLGNRPPRARSHRRPSTIPRSRRWPQVVQPRPPGFCTGLSRAADLRGDETGREGTRAAPRRGGYRLPSVLDPAAVQYWRHDDGLWAGPGFGLGLQYDGGQAARFRSWATAASGITA